MLNRNSSGSILIEAILSVVVFATGIVMIVQAMGTSVKGVQRASEYSTAMMLADNVMFGLIHEGIEDPVFRQSGELDDPYENFRYEIEGGEGVRSGYYDEGEVSEVTMELFKDEDTKLLTLTTLLPIKNEQ